MPGGTVVADLDAVDGLPVADDDRQLHAVVPGDEAVARGDIADVDTAAVARVLANVGADFAGPAVLPTLQSDPKAAADTIVDLVLRGLSTT